MKLLLAEDDALLADALCTQLGAAGCVVEHAPNGPVADYLLQRQAFDIAVLDIGLPMMDGLAVLQQVRRLRPDAAHQLRTPLAGLKSQTEIALAATTEPEGRARLARVHDSATRSAHLVNQLLTLARAEPGAQQPDTHQRLDLQRLARGLAAELVPRALRAGIDLGLDESTPQAVWVQAHELLLREALGNLIDNALRYAGAGAQVTVRVGLHGPDALLEVSDTGPGIAAPDRARVFERFVRATTQGDGCGLGLAIVREIVERHGGRVALEAVQPHGLCVRLLLPLAPSS